MEGPEIQGATYGVELLFDGEHRLEDPAVASSVESAVRMRCPRADTQSGRGLITIFHADVPIALADANICAQTAVMSTDAPVVQGELEPLLQQTRDWDDARAVVRRATRRLLVTDLMSSSLEPERRLEVFQRALAGVVSALRPIAIAWTTAHRIVEPTQFLRAMDQGDRLDRVLLALNVRMFNVGNFPGEMVMDTMGLASLTLPDLQVHFRDIDPNDIAHKLFNTALYVLEKGDVIQDGHTIDGIPPGRKWSCQHEAALVGPSRVVLDFDPGAPYTGGKR